MKKKKTEPPASSASGEAIAAAPGQMSLAFQHDAMLVSFSDLVARSFSFSDGIINVTMRDEHNIVTECIGNSLIARFACINLPFPLFAQLAERLHRLLPCKATLRQASFELQHITVMYSGYDVAGKPRDTIYITDANNQQTLTLLSVSYVRKLHEILQCLLHSECVLLLTGATRPSFFVMPVSRGSIWALRQCPEWAAVIALERGGLFLDDTANGRIAAVPPSLAAQLLQFDASLPQQLDARKLYLFPGTPEADGASEHTPRFAVACQLILTQSTDWYMFDATSWRFFAASLRLYLSLYNLFYTNTGER